MAGHQIFLASATVSELRYGALVAEWGPARRASLEASMQTAVVPVSDSLLTAAAELRHACRRAAHPLHERAHANDLWVAASAVHIDARLLAADGIFTGTPGLRLHQ